MYRCMSKELNRDREYLNETFQDVAYFEPYYLKEFVATVAKNKVF